jgi:hypothetical protein
MNDEEAAQILLAVSPALEPLPPPIQRRPRAFSDLQLDPLGAWDEG